MKKRVFTHLLAAVTLVAACTAPALAQSNPYSGLFVFGDSLSDSGNVAALVGTNPGQVVTGNSYIPSQPYGSGTFSNGNVWVNAFAAGIGLGSAAAPSLGGGGNFAFGGARTATDGVGLPPSLSAQASLFLSATGGTAPSGALYVVAGGGNDARAALQAAAGAGTPAAAAAVIASAAAAHAQSVGAIVDRLQTAGAQNIIVWDVPNLGVAPAVTALGPAASFLGSQVSSSMNAALTARLATEPGVSLFDVYGLVTAAVLAPAAYGLSNVTDACGAVAGCMPSQYLFWDGIHPTSAGHALIAGGMLATVVPEPSTTLLLAGGVVALLALRRRG